MEYWIALLGALAVAGGAFMMARARQRVREAQAGELEVHRLYGQLHEGFGRAVEAETARRSDKLRSSLLQAVTQSLRTPVASIKTSVAALIGEPTRPGLPLGARLELLRLMDQEADRLNLFLDKLVTMAQIEAGAFAVSRRPSSIEDIMQAAVARAMPKLGDRDIEIAAQSDIPAINVDAPAIEEAIYQLLENATTYSPSKTLVRVSASVLRHKTLEIRVEDQGPGVKEDDRARIFEKFFRDPSMKTPGLGLGLAIANGLVAAHGGSVSAENRSHNAGARFTVHLPLGDDEAPA